MSSNSEAGTFSFVKSLDIFPKLDDDYSIQTNTGAKVSLLTFFVVIILFISETSSFFSLSHTQHVTVDTSVAEDMNVNFNLSFPRIKCGSALIDVMDVAGEQQINLDVNVYKLRLTSEGAPIGTPYLDHHKVDAHAHMQQVIRLPNGIKIVTHGGGDEDGEKDPNHHNEDHDHTDTEEDPSKDGEGCNLVGNIKVNRVAGNIHIALGASHKSGGRHIHHFMLKDAQTFDTSHIIHSLSFGPSVPGVEDSNPLEGVSRLLDSGTGHFQYFLKVVPTTYVDLKGVETKTYQYSVTEQEKRVDFSIAGKKKIPGVFFIYDISPFLVTISETSMPFTDFLISLCAIIGGTVVVAGLIDHILSRKTIDDLIR